MPRARPQIESHPLEEVASTFSRSLNITLPDINHEQTKKRRVVSPMNERLLYNSYQQICFLYVDTAHVQYVDEHNQ